MVWDAMGLITYHIVKIPQSTNLVAHPESVVCDNNARSAGFSDSVMVWAAILLETASIPPMTGAIKDGALREAALIGRLPLYHHHYTRELPLKLVL
jgi:hypothetical protein